MIISRHLRTGFWRKHGRISKGALERSLSTDTNVSAPRKIVVTLDPNKFAEKKQCRFHIGNLLSFMPLIALHNKPSPIMGPQVHYTRISAPLHRYPPDTAAFLYYFTSTKRPRIAGELRLRVASSDDHASFESGSDLLALNGQPWSRSLYQVSKRYLPLYKKLREEELVPDELNAILSTFPPKVPRCQLLYTLNDPFIVDFSYFLHSLFVITEQGVAVLRLPGPFAEKRQGGKFRTIYTGSALARFERSTLPEHEGTRTVLLRFLKIIKPVECVIPLYDGHIGQPTEGELHRRTPKNGTVINNDPNQPSWSVTIDKPKGAFVRALQLLWNA